MKLFLQPNDIPALTDQWNIDSDSIKPAINIAQTTQVKKDISTKLYNKIYNDLETLQAIT
jgi:hypothetical protein